MVLVYSKQIDDPNSEYLRVCVEGVFRYTILFKLYGTKTYVQPTYRRDKETALY